MNSLQFEENQFKHLAAILKTNPKELSEVLKNIDKYFLEYKISKKDKNLVVKRFKDGAIKKRTITPSHMRLKILQSAIKKNILDNVEIPSHIQGGVKGKSNISNGKLHQGKKFKLTTDLQDFFPAVSNKLVYSTFLRFGFSNHQANWLTRLTTHKYGLPQGAPTSPHLANFCFCPIDDLLLTLCRDQEITYSRYIDDLTFSSPKDFQNLIAPILNTITGNGFKISYRKTNYNGNQSITGIEVYNNFIDVPKHIKEKVESETNASIEKGPYTNYSKRVRLTNKNIKDNRIK